MDYYSLVVFVHIICGWAFAMTLIIMQLVVANVMKRVPESEGKKSGQQFIQKRWLPVVDTIIILVGLSAIQLFISNFYTIVDDNLLIVKIFVGLIALAAASINHFFFRYKKRKLIKDNSNPKRLKELNYIIALLNRTALIFAPLAGILGVFFNHT